MDATQTNKSCLTRHIKNYSNIVLLLAVSIFSVHSFSETFQLGDLAPRGAPDGQLNAADSLILQRMILEEIVPTDDELLIGDVAPIGVGNGVLDVGDLVVQQRAALGLISLDTINISSLPAPTLDESVASTTSNPFQITGSATPDSSVDIYVEGSVHQATVAADGTFSTYVYLFDDTNNIYAVENDGNDISPQSNLIQIQYVNEISRTLSGTISANTVLTPGSTPTPYLITSTLIVPFGVELIIQPGTKLQFEYRSGLVVNGKLTVRGEALNPSIFSETIVRENKRTSQWDGIIVADGGEVNIEYAVIDSAYQGILFESGSNGIIKNTIFDSNEDNVTFYHGSTGILTSSVITNSYNGIIVIGATGAVIGPDNIINDNSIGLRLIKHFENGVEINPIVIISRNQIYNNAKSVVTSTFVGGNSALLDLQGNYWGSVDVNEIYDSMSHYVSSNNRYSIYYPTIDFSGYLDENGLANTDKSLFGVISDDDTTIQENTTYVALGMIEVAEGKMLTIPEGVTINFIPNTTVGINVLGTLNVAGVANNQVVFTSNKDPLDKARGDWQGVINEGVVNIEQTLIEYAVHGVNFIQNSNGTVTNSTLNKNTHGVYISGITNAVITGTLIENNYYGIFLALITSATIGPDNIITNNTNGIYFNGGGFVYQRATIYGNHIFDNTNSVVAYNFNEADVVIDLQGNYWVFQDYGEIVETMKSEHSLTYDYVNAIFDVSGYLDENGVADSAKALYGTLQEDSPLQENESYLALGDLEIAENTIISIPEGVSIEFSRIPKSNLPFTTDVLWGFIVNGNLNINGSADNPVTLSSNKLPENKSPGDWNGIDVENGGVLNLSYALVEYASNGVTFYSGSDGTITNSKIVDNSVGILALGDDNNAANNPEPVVTNNSIYNNIFYNFSTDNYVGTVNAILDAKNNWWGTVSESVISQNIADWNDDSSNKAIVDFSDYLDGENGDIYFAHELFDCPDVQVVDDSNFSDTYPTNNIDWIGLDYTDVDQIEQAFNHARSLDDNVYQYLKMPSQATWDGMATNHKGLELINSERKARGLKPFQNSSFSVTDVAQSYADFVRTNNQVIGHFNDGNSPVERLDVDPIIRDNRDASVLTENGYEIHGDIPVPSDSESVTRAIYNWIYFDKTPLSGRAWGHRDLILQTGLKENFGDTFNEGLIGFGISSGAYSPDPQSPSDNGAVVFLNIIDPSDSWSLGSGITSPKSSLQCNNRIIINIDDAVVPVDQIRKLEITPSDIYLTPGTSTQINVIATYLDDTQQDITPSTSFIADNLSIIDVNAGTVTAQHVGYVYVVAEKNGVTSNSLLITVNEKTDTTNLNGSNAEDYLPYIPINASVDSYDPKAFSVFTGYVKDKAGSDLDDVTISIHNMPEYGSVKTDINGKFVFAAEAGEQKFVYRKSGYLTLHRSAIASSNAWTVVDEVIMLEVDTEESAISLGVSTPQTHKSTEVTDTFGTRSTTLVFNGINTATVTSADGNTRSLGDFTVRATEYELPKSMPADLPKESAFTYCSELEVIGVRDDEHVIFDKPVVMYVDNFLNFSPGEIVPIGYYDRQKAEWIESDNGIVVKLLDTDSDGFVDGLDINDDNIADDLNQDGSTEDEITGIEDYTPGESYWRGSFNHFTPWDFNWPFIPPSDATGRGDFNAETSNENKEQTELECTGSYVKPETQAFHEDIPITGTDLTLHYSSQRTEGYKHIFNVPVSGDIISESMIEMIVKFNIGGNEYEQTFAPDENIEAEFVWDGTDPSGNRINGIVYGLISIGFKYNTEYSSAGTATTAAEYAAIETAWANIGSNSTGVAGRDEFISWSTNTVAVQNTFDNQFANGWSLSNLHQASPIGSIYKGDGEVIDTEKSSLILKTGVKITQYDGDDGFYQKGGSDIDYAINSYGTLIDKVTGLEWQYIDKPEKFTSKTDAEAYCSAALFTTDATGWRLPTNKEVIYGIDKSGGSHNFPMYTTDAINYWHQATYNIELKALPVICVRGETIDIQSIAALTRDATAEVVVDPENGLMWQDDISVTMLTTGWAGAIDQCENSVHAGYVDWRLPNINELTYALPNTVFFYQTTIEEGPWDPTVFFRKPYWASTPDIQNVDNAWAIESKGFSSDAFNKADPYNVRCVRDNIQSVRSPYRFDEQGKHIQTVDLDSGLVLTTFNYDLDGQLVSITDRFGDTLTLDRDPATGKLLSITTQDGYVTQLNIDANNDLIQVDYADTTNYAFTYGANSLLESKTTPNGAVFNHVFDLEGNGRTIQTSDQEGGVWDFFSSRQGDSSALYGYTTAETNTYQTLRTIQDNGDTNKVTTLFDGTQLSDMKQADDLKQTQQSCAVTTVIDKVIDTKTKEPIPSQITITQPSTLQSITQLTKTYGADTTQQTLTVTLNGKPGTVYSDIKTGITTTTSAENRITTLNVDPTTLLLQSSQTPGLFDTTYTYDARGRQETITTGTRTTTFTYDPVSKGDVTYITADDGKETHFEYDALGRVSDIIYPDTHRVENTYDDNGNLETKIIPTPATHSFTYNSVDKVKTQTRPKEGAVTAVTQYDYDKERNLLQITLPSANVISNSYTDGLLDFTSTPEGMINYSYTCNSKVESITEGGETVTYGYDGSLLEDITYTGALNEAISQTYNTDFNVNTLTYAGQTTVLGYDDDGLLTSTNGYTITRNALNGLPEILANGTLLQTRGFNGYGEAEIVTTKVNTQDVYDYTLNYNDLGKITSKIETLDDGTVNTYVYTYDDRRRLDTVTKNGVLVEDYGYDANGNRTLQTNTNPTRNIINQSASYNLGDQLQTVGTTTYDYDTDAYLKEKVTAAGTTTYQYSSQGRLLHVQTPTKLIAYKHNAIGNRVEKKVDGVVTEKYLWLDKTMLLATYDATGTLLQRYHYTDGHTPGSFTQGGVTYYIVTDHLGSPRAITDSSGAIVKKLDYDSFGNVSSDSNPGFGIPFGFAGGLQDKDTGLIRFGFRDYDPDVGRWTARDPIGFGGGDSNLYGYTFNDPVNYVDSDGLQRTRVFNPANTGTGGGAKASINISLGVLGVNISESGVSIPANFNPGVGVTLQVTSKAKGNDYRAFSGGLGIAGNGFSVNDQGQVTISIGLEYNLIPFVTAGVSPTDPDIEFDDKRQCP